MQWYVFVKKKIDVFNSKFGIRWSQNHGTRECVSLIKRNYLQCEVATQYWYLLRHWKGRDP